MVWICSDFDLYSPAALPPHTHHTAFTFAVRGNEKKKKICEAFYSLEARCHSDTSELRIFPDSRGIWCNESSIVINHHQHRHPTYLFNPWRCRSCKYFSVTCIIHYIRHLSACVKQILVWSSYNRMHTLATITCARAALVYDCAGVVNWPGISPPTSRWHRLCQVNVSGGDVRCQVNDDHFRWQANYLLVRAIPIRAKYHPLRRLAWKSIRSRAESGFDLLEKLKRHHHRESSRSTSIKTLTSIVFGQSFVRLTVVGRRT